MLYVRKDSIATAVILLVPHHHILHTHNKHACILPSLDCTYMYSVYRAPSQVCTYMYSVHVHVLSLLAAGWGTLYPVSTNIENYLATTLP